MNKACEREPQSSTGRAPLHLREAITEPPHECRGSGSASVSMLYVKSVMSQQLRLAGQLIAMHGTEKQGQQGSPRGNMEKETGYIVLLMGGTLLLADSNDVLRHHIAI